MTYYDPPHEARDANKLSAMIEYLRSGGTLPPIVVCGSQALTGSHRIEAHRTAAQLADQAACAGNDNWDNYLGRDATLPIVEIDEDEYAAVLDAAGIDGLDEIGDWNEFVAVVCKVIDRQDVRDALADQVYDHAR